MYCSFCGTVKHKCRNEILVGNIERKFPFICVSCLNACKAILRKSLFSKEKIIQFEKA